MNDLLEKKTHYNILFSYYHNLLTLKQQQVFKFYYEEDYSLSEISEELSISRNAVFDNLKKTIMQLDKYESILELKHKDDLREQIYKKYSNEHTQELIKELREMEW